VLLVQVCYQITDENFQRERQGLFQAMEFFGQSSGFIITFNQKDRFEQDGKLIEMIPAAEFLSQE
jgi:hypothetical protein